MAAPGAQILPGLAAADVRVDAAMVGVVEIERGKIGAIPYAAVGSGRPVVVSAGLWPATGVAGDGFVRGVLAPVRGLASKRRLIVVNRRAGLPADLTMSGLAAEYADAIRADLGGPVDLVGTSTGGSIAQQLAADHPDVVRRLVLLSTACRLGPYGRELQGFVAAQLRAGRVRRAVGAGAADLAPPGLRTLARGLGWAAAGRVVPSGSAAADLAATLEAEDGFDLAACKRPIEATTLIIGGGRDRFYGAGLFEETAALIPGSILRLFPRHGHISVTSDLRAQATLAGFLAAPQRDRDAT
jgi:pimeloyl-ACP methyl ester carboxylesterase